MTPIEIALVGLAVLVGLIMLRVPVAVALGLVGYVGYAMLEGWTRAGLILGTAPVELAQAYTFSVVPLFTLMGSVAAVSGLSSDLFRAANAVMRGTRGSLAVAAIFASGMFGAICGSSVATALTMSRVSIPEMLRGGYNPSFAAGAVAAGGTLGILIPPSLILMIYAIIAQLSVAKLFAAALIPGLFLMAFYAMVALILSRRMKFDAPPPPVPPLLGSLGRIWHVVLLFTVTIGGIYTGFFTPTEAAAVGALGAVLLALLTGRSGIKTLAATALDTVRLVSTVIFIVMASTIFSYFVVQTGLSNAVSDKMQHAGFGPLGVIVVLCVAYIAMGCFLEGIAMILITVPIVLPLVLSFGYDPVWFGVLLVILIEIGLITPPVGMNLFVIRAVSPELKVTDIYFGALPFLVAPVVLIALMIAWPQMVLWLPSLID
jgi:tripartite ATP-independent transporter DctM subunit